MFECVVCLSATKFTLWIKWHIRSTAKYSAINLPLCNLPPYTHHYTYLFAALKGNRLRVSLKDFIPAFPFFFPLFNPPYWKRKKRSKSATEVFDRFLTDSFLFTSFLFAIPHFPLILITRVSLCQRRVGKIEQLYNFSWAKHKSTACLRRAYRVLSRSFPPAFRVLSACAVGKDHMLNLFS